MFYIPEQEASGFLIITIDLPPSSEPLELVKRPLALDAVKDLHTPTDGAFQNGEAVFRGNGEMLLGGLRRTLQRIQHSSRVETGCSPSLTGTLRRMVVPLTVGALRFPAPSSTMKMRLPSLLSSSFETYPAGVS